MGIRETLNKNPTLTAGATAGIIAIALGYILYSEFVSNRPNIPTKSFYTTDDGQTFFTDDIKKIPPYDHDGKEAVRCYVFKCPDKGKFVGYMERYTPEGKAALERTATGTQNGPPPQMMVGPGEDMDSIEVKKPGDAEWVKRSSMLKSGDTLNVSCADGKPPEPVIP